MLGCPRSLVSPSCYLVPGCGAAGFTPQETFKEAEKNSSWSDSSDEFSPLTAATSVLTSDVTAAEMGLFLLPVIDTRIIFVKM